MPRRSPLRPGPSSMAPLLCAVRMVKCYTTVQHPLRGADVSDNELSYDPCDIEIDADPYPVYERLRNEGAALLQRAPRRLGAHAFSKMSKRR